MTEPRKEWVGLIQVAPGVYATPDAAADLAKAFTFEVNVDPATADVLRRGMTTDLSIGGVDLAEYLAAQEVPTQEDRADVDRVVTKTPPMCGRGVDTGRPVWMGPDQYQPCPCVLNQGHVGACRCQHGVER